jgi:hypothetical protein
MNREPSLSSGFPTGGVKPRRRPTFPTIIAYSKHNEIRNKTRREGKLLVLLNMRIRSMTATAKITTLKKNEGHTTYLVFGRDERTANNASEKLAICTTKNRIG